MGSRDSPPRPGDNPLLRLAKAVPFGRFRLMLRGRDLEAFGRDLARDASPGDAPDMALPGSDISRAEQEAALRREQQRRAERRARRRR